MAVRERIASIFILFSEADRGCQHIYHVQFDNLHFGSDILFLFHIIEETHPTLPVREGTATSRYRVGFAKLLLSTFQRALTPSLTGREGVGLPLFYNYLVSIHDVDALGGVCYAAALEVVDEFCILNGEF